ncbi:unnamed protein product [Brassica oleracea var. botrytis]
MKWIHIGSCDERWWNFFCPRHIFSNLFTSLIRKVKDKKEARGERRRDMSGVRRKEN